TFTAMGVSYRLLAMFMLAPELDGRRPQAVFGLGTGALAVAIVGGLVTIRLGGNLDLTLGLAGLLGLATLALYGADILYLYRARKQPKIELNSRMAAFALVSLAASVLLMIALVALGNLQDQIGALVFLVAFGWLTGLG